MYWNGLRAKTMKWRMRETDDSMQKKGKDFSSKQLRTVQDSIFQNTTLHFSNLREKRTKL